MDRNVNIIVGLNGERIFISSSFPDEYVGSESRLALKGAAAKAKANAAQGMVSGLADMGKIKLDAKTEKCVRGMAGNVTEEAVLGVLDGGKGRKSVGGRSVMSVEVYERYFGSVKPGRLRVLWRTRWRRGSGKGNYFP